ncbi:pyridoxal-phosphate dependent enzyme [Hymenobacter latericus]|uniref:pyridoxal-phosphate dependent enzyme n=1 Tax=Hymenobacter sp. YIM 151858-1 TaxID=2987688 RepID=UPI002227CA06|nr:pyridoxal-phosphate dependent enzyme [Hymenobacter sp. YIM 151858-1]UYZ57830.1 pyridoxal-phosphate dependent enzyme [Hymenobacter sp. YIM 151858-1]
MLLAPALKAALAQTHARIQPYVHNTPVLTSHLLDELAGATLYFKCENFQRMGAFKMRGAVNAIMQLSAEEQQRGVVTHSSGNFAQALALAAQSLGVAAYIVMPNNAPRVKKEAVLAYGGQVVECAPTLAAREQAAQQIVAERGATFIHPSNDLNVILGQGTAAVELLSTQPALDYIFTPVGGGGLVAGTILAAQHFGRNCRVVAGEPATMDDAYRSWQSGTIEGNAAGDTIADGLKTQLGDINFPIIRQGIEAIVLVSEDEIVAAMRLLWERLKIVVEASSAVALAALLKDKTRYAGKQIGIILSGGNVDLSKLPF